ncbi:hypothetical protein SETIT_5G286500v2 [Setaria italica]|uniref:Uncharacterized protein n=2 Tax=Setaria TaxID=4554 RepID=A0A368R9V1_SETIT|nr:hypothetical protein SETIT_5G286500v2 [Setaria italica]TKW16273.1 hypothetical protein SEVIR_5G289300v2 [Setaria viridis]
MTLCPLPPAGRRRPQYPPRAPCSCWPMPPPAPPRTCWLPVSTLRARACWPPPPPCSPAPAGHRQTLYPRRPHLLAAAAGLATTPSARARRQPRRCAAGHVARPHVLPAARPRERWRREWCLVKG